MENVTITGTQINGRPLLKVGNKLLMYVLLGTMLCYRLHGIACNSVIISLCSILNGSFRNWRNLMKQLHG
jgi:hypothetical protein